MPTGGEMRLKVKIFAGISGSVADAETERVVGIDQVEHGYQRR